jgi:3-hydroxyacyl-[acyl-carrier-protein] dehydratase
MSELAEQIRRHMLELRESGEGELKGRFLFSDDFIGFRGHFPGRPILPAVCEIQAAIAMLEVWKKKDVRLREIVSAKFTNPVTCDEELMYLCSVQMEDDESGVVKTKVAKQGNAVARFKLRVVFEDTTQEHR